MTVPDFGATQVHQSIEYFVDACEIERMLGIDHRTVQQMAREGIIPAYPLGDGIRKTWRFLPSGGSRLDATPDTLGGPSVPLESEETELSKARYQQGSIRRVQRKKGPDVWVFRWLDTKADGSRRENNRVIGSVLEYRTKAAATKAAETLRININSTTPRPSVFGMSFQELSEHYVARELDPDQSGARKPKSHSTIEAYRRYLKRWIVPRWGSEPIQDIEPVAIEDWLARLGQPPYKLAKGTRQKIRNIMSAVFRHGMRHGFLPRDAEANPLKYVRQNGGSTKEHTILSAEQAMSIIENLQEPVRTMALLDACTGLRASELTALRSEDVDFNAGVLHIRRGSCMPLSEM